ncbi:MAG: hypothetical protein AAF671_07430 [Pseudomonadota bacterium]
MKTQCIRLICLLATTLLTLAPPSRAEILDGVPDVIVCSVADPTGVLPWQRLVYYVSARMSNGDTLFKTLTSDPVVILVDEQGMIKGPNLVDCDGRNVKSLVQEGRAFALVNKAK